MNFEISVILMTFGIFRLIFVIFHQMCEIEKPQIFYLLS